LLGGYSLYPFHELLEHLCDMEGFPCELWPGVYDNYTAKNEMVRDFYLRMGFALTRENEQSREFELKLDAFQPVPTKIKIIRLAHESS
jgi:hypothetical protein